MLAVMSADTPIYFLLVDDLEENLLSLEALLRRDNLVLLKARTGVEALELLLRYDVALALLDVQMPGMDGFELAELMRGTEKTRRIPIIFLTAGSADWQRRFRGYEAGAVDFLHKPVEPDILKSKASVFYELYLQRQLVARQRDELRQYAEALKEADHRKDVFLATLAHELRNPLAPIRNGLQILRMTTDDALAAEVRDMMDRQLNHMVRLIDDLLDVSRISKGKIILKKDAITLQSALQAAIEGNRPVIEAEEHEFLTDIPDKPVWVHADLTRLSQVISNLLNNAAKYTQTGGRIALSVKPQEDHVLISVSDNGLGIKSDMLPKVFDLFTQIDRSLDHSQGGLGIGLALVKQLVEMHGGWIRAESDGLGAGSTFTVCLPTVLHEDDEAAPDAVYGPDKSAAPLQILVVDDNVDSAKTIGWMLEMLGHEAVLAHSGQEALDRAKNMTPDVILLDIGLPGMNGYEVCRSLRQDPLFRNTLIIAQTGWGQDRDKDQAQDAGFNHHLIKPIRLDDLSALLEKFS